MKKKLIALVATGAAFTMAVGIAAACNKTTDEGTYTVTYMDGTTVLSTEKVKEGEAPQGFTPTKDGGYEFVNWFATPSKNHVFDMTAAITEDVTVYAGFTLFKDDTRTFYVVGSGSSELLFTSNWGKVITDTHKLTKKDGVNEYTITMDLKENDQFQFAINDAWENKRGYGYLSTLTLEDGTKVFDGEGSPYDDSSKGSNIKCVYSGNYTLTLKTYPNEDYYNTSASTYTEETKEVYNIGTYDTIEWVRNGDVVNDSITLNDFYIKGNLITGWADVYNPSTQMLNNGTNYTMSIYLKEGDEFMFTSRITKITDEETTYSTGSDYIKATNLTADSKNYLSGDSNMKAKASGIYTFNYDVATKTCAVTFEAKAAAAYDYYFDGNVKLDGTSNPSYGAFITTPNDYRLTETAEGSGVYEIKGVVLPKDAEILIRAYAAGSTADWSTTHTDYQYLNMTASLDFAQAADDNYNIKVVNAGTYNIRFDSYTKLITIISDAGYDVYISGSMASQNGWDPAFNSQFRFVRSETDKDVYELTMELAADVQFGLRVFPAGTTAEDGINFEWKGVGIAGSEGITSTFVSASNGSNFVVPENGTYKLTYNSETGELNVYSVQS